MQSSATRVLPLAVGLAKTKFFPFKTPASMACCCGGWRSSWAVFASLYIHSDIVESVAHYLDCALRILNGHLVPEKRAGSCLGNPDQPFELSWGYCDSGFFAGGIAHLQIEILELLYSFWG